MCIVIVSLENKKSEKTAPGTFCHEKNIEQKPTFAHLYEDITANSNNRKK